MSALLVLTFLAAFAVLVVLVHRDGIEIGREREICERRRREAEKAKRHINYQI